MTTPAHIQMIQPKSQRLFERPIERDDFTNIKRVEDNPPEWLSVVEASILLNLSDKSVRKLAYSGELKSRKVSNRLMISLESVRNYLAEENDNV